jgi:hypothetical protein
VWVTTTVWKRFSEIVEKRIAAWNGAIWCGLLEGREIRRSRVGMKRHNIRHDHGGVVATKISIFELAVSGHLRKSEGPPPPRTLTQKVPFKLLPPLY